MAMNEPRVVVLGGLLSHEECDELIAQAERRLTRSETVQTDTGAGEVNAARTSQGMFFERGERAVPAHRGAHRRADRLAGGQRRGHPGCCATAPAPNKPHYDYFDPAPGTPRIPSAAGSAWPPW